MSRRSLTAIPAAVVLLRLLVALAPAEPMGFGVPLGVWLELGVVAASTAALAVLSRHLLSGAREEGRR